MQRFISTIKTTSFNVVVFFMCVFATETFSQTTVASLPADISPLLIGEKIPDSKLHDVNGQEVGLSSLIAAKPSVLIFYRGGWCPYCNLHLNELQGIEDKLIKLGYQIIAISADSPKKLKETRDNSKLKYVLLSDSKTDAIQSFGLAFSAPEQYKDVLPHASDNNNVNVLPVPAVFILNTQGEILFEYISPNFMKRVPGKLLLAAAEALKKQ
jgi:peroxiredoxin